MNIKLDWLVAIRERSGIERERKKKQRAGREEQGIISKEARDLQIYWGNVTDRIFKNGYV